MDNLFLYLLKVSTGIALFYLCYILFFSRDTFYLRNRIFLTAILILSVLIPTLNVFSFSGTDSTLRAKNVMNNIILSGTSLGATVSEKITSFDFINLLTWIYFLISGLFLLRVLISVVRTIIIIMQGTLIDAGFPKVVESESDHPPFSFFPYIVIPKKNRDCGDYSEILAHENAHITQGHTFDLLFVELFISLLWFNPFIWLIKRSIVLNHEYLADNFSLKGSSNIKEYQYKLLNIPKSLMNAPLAHNFSSLIKNRIIMINKRPTQNYAALKNIIILPVAALLLVMFSFKPESHTKNSGFQEPLFSKSSESEILKFLAINIAYPQAAKNSYDTGKVYVMVKMNKGGIIKECKAFNERKDISVPVLNEVVIAGYKPSPGQKETGSEKTKGNEHLALRTECLRISNKLPDINIPEWKTKDMEFALEFKFILK